MLGCTDPEVTLGVRTYSIREALADEFIQVSSEAPTMGDLMCLTIMVGVALFCLKMRGVVLDGSQTPNPGLVLDGVEDLVDGEPERSELFCRLLGSERAR